MPHVPWTFFAYCPIVGDSATSDPLRGRVRAVWYERVGWPSFNDGNLHDFYQAGATHHDWYLRYLTRTVVQTDAWNVSYTYVQTIDPLTSLYTGDWEIGWTPHPDDVYEYNEACDTETITRVAAPAPPYYLTSQTTTLTNRHKDWEITAILDDLWDGPAQWGAIEPGYLKMWGLEYGTGAQILAAYVALGDWGLEGTSDWPIVWDSIAEIGQAFCYKVEHRSVAVVDYCVREHEPLPLPCPYSEPPSRTFGIIYAYPLPVEQDIGHTTYTTDDDGQPLTCAPKEVTVEAPDWVVGPPYCRIRIPCWTKGCPAF